MVRVGLKGLLVNTGEGDARHGFKVKGEEGRMGRRRTDYILLVLASKVMHSCHSFPAAAPRSPQEGAMDSLKQRS